MEDACLTLALQRYSNEYRYLIEGIWQWFIFGQVAGKGYLESIQCVHHLLFGTNRTLIQSGLKMTPRQHVYMMYLLYLAGIVTDMVSIYNHVIRK